MLKINFILLRILQIHVWNLLTERTLKRLERGKKKKFRVYNLSSCSLLIRYFFDIFLQRILRF